MSRYISFITLLFVIALLIVLFYKVMAGFFVPLFLAALLVVIFRPFHLWVLEKVKGKAKVAASLTTTAVLLIVFVPMTGLFVMAAFEGQQIVETVNKTTLLQNIEDARTKLNLKQPEIAQELNVVEVRLKNIAEIEFLEDVTYLRSQLLNVSVFHEDIAEELENDPHIENAWTEYLTEFANLEALQDQIANPTLDENAAEGEPGGAERTAVQLYDFQHQLNQTIEKFTQFKIQVLGGNAFLVWLNEMANPTPELLEEYGSGAISYGRDFLVGLGASTTSFLLKLVVGGFIMIIALYFFLLDGAAMLESLKQLSPIDDVHEQELIVEFGNVSRAVVLATLLAALVQAVLGGIGYYFAGLESVFLLTLLTGCLALVPFLGAAAVWVPCVLWLYFVDHNATAAIGLALFGGVISVSDNFIKPLVLHGQSNLHPLFALLSVLGGVAALGPIGILIGPMIVAFLQTLLKILQREMVTLDSSSSNDSPPCPDQEKPVEAPA